MSDPVRMACRPLLFGIEACDWVADDNVVSAEFKCPTEIRLLSRNMDDRRQDFPWRISRLDRETGEPVGHLYGATQTDALKKMSQPKSCRLKSFKTKAKALDGLGAWETKKIGDVTVQFDIAGDKMKIASIRVPVAKRGKGAAGNALAEILAFADDNNLTAELLASPLDKKTSLPKLVRFYERHGFAVVGRGNPAGDPLMVRPPSQRPALSALPRTGRIPLATAKRALSRLGRKAKTCGITPAALREGMEVEREHRDVTRGDALKTAKIAAAHLCERPDYYKRLKRFVEK